MFRKTLNLILSTALLSSAISCDKPECKNTNPVFSNFTPDTKEYKNELANQIKNIGAENLSYWHSGYVKKDTAEYILVFMQGKDLCAVGELQVRDWQKISGMRRDVSGYRGSELKGLKFDIRQDSAGTNIVFKDVVSIID
jgi:hypothetical protein